jgi:hypothetical protein
MSLHCMWAAVLSVGVTFFNDHLWLLAVVAKYHCKNALVYNPQKMALNILGS